MFKINEFSLNFKNKWFVIINQNFEKEEEIKLNYWHMKIRLF